MKRLETPPLICIKSSEQYQYDTVKAGERKRVWYLPVTGGYVGFIHAFSCDWYANGEWEWSVDGWLVEKVRREVPVGEPQKYEPPIVAQKHIKWIYYNGDTNDHVVGVYLDAQLCRPKT